MDRNILSKCVGFLKVLSKLIFCLLIILLIIIIILIISIEIYGYNVIMDIPNNIDDFKITKISSDEIDGSLELYSYRFDPKHYLFLRTEGKDELIGEFVLATDCLVEEAGENKIKVTTKYYDKDEKIYFLNLDKHDTHGIVLLYRILSYISDDYKVKL